MKATLIWIMLFWAMAENAEAQYYINSITKLERDFSIFAESIWYNDTLIVAGNAGIYPSTLDATFVKYAADGSYISHFFLVDSTDESNFIMGFTGLMIDDGKIVHIASQPFELDDEYKGLIFKSDMNGNFLDSASFRCFYYPNQKRLGFRDFKKIPSGYIISELSWRSDHDPQSCILRLDNSFNIVWRHCYGNSSKEIPNQIFPLSNGHFILLSNSTNIDITEPYQGAGNAFHRGYIIEVDGDGNLLWEWLSPDNSEATLAGYLENDTTLIVAAGLGIEKCTDPGNPNTSCRLLWTGGIYKFDLKARQKLWETRLSGGPYTTMFDNSYLDIIPSIEKDGYILCGAGYDLIPDCRIDTVDKCWANPGVIAKVSNNGDSLWLRKYFGVTDIYESNRLSDVEITPTGGYSLVGEAYNPWPGPTSGQFGWLLMTDSYGCLVPGCQLVSTKDVEHEEINLLLYPNPANDFLSFYCSFSPALKEMMYSIIDNEGRVLFRSGYFESNTTNIYPVENLIPGVYFLQLSSGNRIVKSAQFIVAH